MTDQSRGVSRRTLAKGAAWSVPAVVVGASAPAFAASPTQLDVRFYNESGCVGTSGIADVYMNVNLTNTTGAPYTLPTDIVLRVTSTNPNRNHAFATTSWGSRTCETPGQTLTECDVYLWTIPAGTTVAAGDSIDFAIHFLSHAGQPTQLTTEAVSGGAYLDRPTSSTATWGYTGPSGCVSYGPF